MCNDVSCIIVKTEVLPCLQQQHQLQIGEHYNNCMVRLVAVLPESSFSEETLPGLPSETLACKPI